MSPGSPRLLFLTESFHPVLGGGERHIRVLSARLAAAGMATTVLTRQGDPGWLAKEWLDGVRVLRVPPAGPGRSGKYRMVPAVLAALRKERRSYDVVVVRGTRVLGLPGLVAARALGKRVVLQAEINGELSGEVYTWGTRLAPPLAGLVHSAVRARNRLLLDAEAFVAMSRQIRDEFLAAGVAPEKVVLLPHGVDTKRFRPATPNEKAAIRDRLGLPQAGRLVIYTGRLLAGKGLEALVDAFAALARADQDLYLLLVGSGRGQSLSVEEALQDRVCEAGLADRVLFTGRVDNVEQYLQASDVFAFPSVFEALGLSLIEAAACGLPAVGSRTGGILDVIEDGASGVLVEPGDPAVLARSLSQLLSDPARRAAMGSQARAVAIGRFDLDASVERYRTLFHEAAARK